jgi:type I restriction enzyme S subunit
MSDYERILADLPDEWTKATIEDLGSVVSGGTPSREIANYWGGTIPWVTPGELTTLKEKTLRLTNESITDEGLRQSGANLLPAGSLLVTTRASLGYCAINPVPVTTNQGFKSIVFRQSSNPNFYYHWTRKIGSELKRRASGTTFLEISGSDFKQIELPVPPSEEQQKIAQILDTLDTQIQKTEALIAKLEKIKEGLLHDLLTRGIDQNGQLRPTPEQAPELYKESALGLIPEGWKATTIGGLGVWRGGATPSKGNQKFWPSQGLLWVSPKDLNQDTIDITEDKVSDLACEAANLTIFPPETVLVVFRSGILRRKLPVVKVLKMFTVNQDIKALLPSDEISKGFIHYLLQGHAKGILNSSLKAGTTVESLDFRFFSSYRLPLPPLDEQEKISARLGSIEKRLAQEIKFLEKQKINKIGLMDDLLTGHVRVTPLLKDAV